MGKLLKSDGEGDPAAGSPLIRRSMPPLLNIPLNYTTKTALLQKNF